MVVVEFEYVEMKKFVDLPKEKMVALLSEMGAPSEYEPEVGKIIVELTPNRPDWYSMEGLARALKAYYKGQIPRYQTKKSKYVVTVDPSVTKIRPYTVCAVVKNLRFNDQRIKDMVLLQEKLLGTLGRKVKKFGLGIYPLHAIKFPVSYTTLKPKDIVYTPLGHTKAMNADEVLEKHKKGQQYGHLIKGQERYPVFIDADKRIMCLIPIVNSAETGKVDENTQDIFVEVTGTDIHSCKAALNILVCTFADMGGEIYEVKMEYSKVKFQSPDLKPKLVKMNIGKVNKILGTALTEKEIVRFLRKMGYGYTKGNVVVPPYRADVLDIVDVIEDIAIAYGYNDFQPTTPNFFSSGEIIRKYDYIDKIMCGMGFLEAKTFILTNKEKLDVVGDSDGVMEIANPGTVEYTVVRPHLLVDMLDVFRINKMKSVPQRFYEIGVVYSGQQTKHLVFGIMDKKLDFSEVRGYLQTLCFERKMDFSLVKKEIKAFDKNYSCSIISNGKEIGIFGKVSGNVIEKLGLDFEVYICEIDV